MFGSKLKQLREDAKLPQRKLAALLDIDTATYSKIENGLFALRKECNGREKMIIENEKYNILGMH